MTRRRRVGLPRGPNVAGAVRHTIWRNLFHAVGGYRVRGRAPYEAMVVVANHASHADTPALVAAFPSPYKPVVVAADDYWYRSPLVSRLLELAIGAVPVTRSGGGYEGLVEGAQKVLGTGSSLLVFPEGTRSVDGTLGEFRSGAARIAKEFDVPLLPVAVVGTHALWPKGGRLRPGPVEVRLGRPIQPEDLDDDLAAARDQIAALLAQGPPEPSESRTWHVVNHHMSRPTGLVAAGAWGFAEAIVWPVTAEMFLALFAAANPRRAPAAAAALATGSVAGLVTTALLTRRGVRVPAPLVTPSMRATAAAHMARGARGIWPQTTNGVPGKLYAIEAGRQGIPLGRFAAAAAGSRGVRALVAGTVVALAAGKAEMFLRRFFGPYLGGASVSYAVGLAIVVRRWRHRSA